MAEKLPAYATPDQIPLVVNNLTSDSTTSALSAAQGKALNGKIENFNSYHAGVSANTSFVLDIEEGSTYLISHMTSSDASARLIMIMRRYTDCQLIELGKGSWQSYYTETLANGKWTFANGGYYTILNYIKF